VVDAEDAGDASATAVFSF